MKKRNRIILICILSVIYCILSVVIGYTFLQGLLDGFDPSHKDARKLIAAIKKEDYTAVEQMLKAGVDPNVLTGEMSVLWRFAEMSPDRPLTVACDTGNLEIVQLLIGYGASVTRMRDGERSPLMETVWFYQEDDCEIVMLLLENGADANEGECDNCEPPVVRAAQMPPYAYETLGPDNPCIYDEETAIGITRIVHMLCDDPREIAYGGERTLLMYAAQSGNLYLVEDLLACGCDPEEKDSLGRTAYDLAIEGEHFEIAEILRACE